MVNQTIYEHLKQVARNGETVAYSDIARLIGLDMENPGDRVRLSHILGEISTEECKNGRPLLSAVVTYLGENEPGSGFFDMARDNGLYTGHTEMENLAFFAQELKRVHEYWKNH